ncbi:Subtilisin-like protease SBT5.4 [Linum perenne]
MAFHLVHHCILVSFLLQSVAFGAQKNYIVYLGSHSHGGGIAQLSNPDDVVQAVTQSHYTLLGSLIGSSERARDAMGYSYTWNINGFSAVLEEEEAAELSKRPGVVSVFLDRGRELHTTRSWDYMLLENNGAGHPGELWKAANFGEDTGVWPESKSFDDKGYGPVPSKWKGICQNNTKAGVPCNRKLIGARYFSKGYTRAGGKPEESFESARDSEGHGSHTLSTAAGNFVPQVKILNFTVGTAKGGSPKARVAAYKVCWPPIDGSGCFDSDILAAFDAAINDGVDVISVSLGGDPADYFEDSVAIGSFHAVRKGIDVACSAGNSGPALGTVSNIAPWITTVAASTLDRKLDAYAQLHNGLRIQGVTLSGSSSNKTYPLRLASQVRAANVTILDALLCKANTLDRKKARGKIVVCLRGENGRLEKGSEAASAGAAGMIFCNDKTSGEDVVADPHFLPAVHISYKDSLAVYHYINSTQHPEAYISPVNTKLNVQPTPVMASFSSAGPSSIAPQIIKPDITAPGVNIIAAYTEAKQTGIDADPRKFPYNILSGTSMSCPHVAGVTALLRTLYPSWSPAAIRSAIMTTARTRDDTRNPIKDSSNERATPFNYGSGHIRPNQAMNPGLVYDLSEVDYLNFLCARGYNQTLLSLFAPHECSNKHAIVDLNYPSIAVPRLPMKEGSVTVTRKVKNVGNKAARYAVSVKQPVGVSISVKPAVLKFDKVGEEKAFEVKLEAKSGGKINEYVFGGITWSDGVHHVRSPVAVSVA